MPLNLPMPMPRRYVKQILSAYDRGGHKVASRTGQRTVARAVVRALLDGAAADAGRPREARRVEPWWSGHLVQIVRAISVITR